MVAVLGMRMGPARFVRSSIVDAVGVHETATR